MMKNKIKIPFDSFQTEIDWKGYGNKESYLQSVFFPKEKKFKYRKHSVLVGRNKYNKKIIKINFSESHKILILGPTGSGKSALMRGIFVDRFFKAGGVSVVLTDLKPEYFTSIREAQEEFRKNYAKNEQPTALDVKVYYPKCFEYLISNYKSYLKLLPKFGVTPIPIALSIKDISISDFYTLVDREYTDRQKEAIEKLFRYKEGKKDVTLQDLIDYLSNTGEFDYSTMRAVKTTFESLINMEVISEKYGFDIIKDINENKFVILSLAGKQAK